jgi:hypothetical protein
VATPLTAFTVAVPWSTPPPPLDAAFKDKVTAELSVVTVLPYWSSTATTIVAMVSAPGVLAGSVVNANLAEASKTLGSKFSSKRNRDLRGFLPRPLPLFLPFNRASKLVKRWRRAHIA